MNPKHTPGQWAFELDDDGITDIRAVIYVEEKRKKFPGRIEIAQVESQPQVKANARLIAAAPDLLVVCKEVYKFVGGDAANPAIGRPLRAAIVKAEKARI